MGLLFSLHSHRHSRGSSAGRCRLRLRAGFGHTGSASSPIRCGRANDPLTECALGGLRYARLNARWEIAEFDHRPSDWSQARRCIVARKLIEEADPEPTLFTLERYAYRGWHTNLPWFPFGAAGVELSHPCPRSWPRIVRGGRFRLVL